MSFLGVIKTVGGQSAGSAAVRWCSRPRRVVVGVFDSVIAQGAKASVVAALLESAGWRSAMCWTHDLAIAVNWKADAVNCKVLPAEACACNVAMMWFDGAEISGPEQGALLVRRVVPGDLLWYCI